MDKVMVLGKGYQLFYGSPAEAEEWFTSRLCLERPPHTSPADFIVDQANIDFTNKSSFYSSGLVTEHDLHQVGSQ